MVAVKDLLINTGTGFATEEFVSEGNLFETAGQALGQVSTVLEEKQNRDTESFINEKLFDFRNQQNENLLRRRVEHDDIDSFTDEFSAAFDSDASTILADAQDRDFIDENIVRNKIKSIKSGMVDKSISFQASEKSRVSQAAREKAGDAIVVGALITDDFEAARAEQDALFESMRDKTTPSELEEFAQKQRTKLATSRIQKAIEDNPDEVDELLEGEQEDLTPESIKLLTAEAAQRTKMIRDEYEKDLEVRQDKTRFEFFAIMNENPIAVTNEMIAMAVKNNSLDPDDGEALIKFKTTDPSKVNDLFALADMDSKLTSGNLTTKQIINQHSLGKITQATAEKYISQVNSGALNTPAGKQAGLLIEASYEKEAFGVMSPEAQEALAEDRFELFTRVTDSENPENPILVARDINDRNEASNKIMRENSLTIRRFKKENPGIKTKKDVDERTQKVLDAVVNGRIKAEDAKVQYDVLDLVKESLSQ